MSPASNAADRVRADDAKGGAHLHDHVHASGDPDAVATLRSRGMRLTAPRRAVLDALTGRAEYLTADEVALLVDADDVHRATVYRTLELFAAAGIVSLRQIPGGAARYHLSVGGEREHLHGHCRGCGTVVVLPADALDTALTRIADTAGFELDPAQTTLVGRCADCLTAEPPLSD